MVLVNLLDADIIPDPNWDTSVQWCIVPDMPWILYIVCGQTTFQHHEPLFATLVAF